MARIAHGQLANFVVESALIATANFRSENKVHVMYRSGRAGPISRGAGMEVLSFWVI
jgi:hypothetical protein